MPQSAIPALDLGPARVRIEGGIVGSRLAWSLYVKYPDPLSPDPENPDYLPFDFTGYTLLAEVKESVHGTALTEIDLTEPGTRGAGYIDCLLTATQTTALGHSKKGFDASLKGWPTGDPDAAVTFILMAIPLSHGAST